MFETLKKLLENNEAGLAEIAKIEKNYVGLSSEVETLESKLQEAVTKRDKYKNFTKTVKGKLGIEEGEELTEDTLNEKVQALLGKKDSDLSEKERVFKLEVMKLEEALKNKDTEFQTKLNETSTSILDTKLELELYKTSAGINAINDKAHSMIIEELKKGATIEDGTIIFKSKDGTSVRKNGVVMTLSEKLDDIKTSEDFSFLFKADVKSGSGLQTTSGKGNAGSLEGTDFSRAKAAQLKASGFNI